jgi:hypothetical protein
MAFTAAQQALGAIHFENELQRPSSAVLDDTKKCLPSPFSQVKAIDHIRRHFRWAGLFIICDVDEPLLFCNGQRICCTVQFEGMIDGQEV